MGDTQESNVNIMAANMMKDYAMGKARETFEENKSYLSFLNLDTLKIYFDVTNSYVLHKLKIILFPFLLKEDDWKRGQRSFEA
jgi:hypothetical protein